MCNPFYETGCASAFIFLVFALFILPLLAAFLDDDK
jgi:hypothetical protein